MVLKLYGFPGGMRYRAHFGDNKVRMKFTTENIALARPRSRRVRSGFSWPARNTSSSPASSSTSSPSIFKTDNCDIKYKNARTRSFLGFWLPCTVAKPLPQCSCPLFWCSSFQSRIFLDHAKFGDDQVLWSVCEQVEDCSVTRMGDGWTIATTKVYLSNW